MDAVYLLGIFGVLFGSVFVLDRIVDYREKNGHECCGNCKHEEGHECCGNCKHEEGHECCGHCKHDENK
jgi:hypothetical protein